jgi:hypothetical protein
MPQLLERRENAVTASGGAPPAPSSAEAPALAVLRGLSGNERLIETASRAKELQDTLTEWKRAAALIAQRLPVFRVVERWSSLGLADRLPHSLTSANAGAYRRNRSRRCARTRLPSFVTASMPLSTLTKPLRRTVNIASPVMQIGSGLRRMRNIPPGRDRTLASGATGDLIAGGDRRRLDYA